jgi:hypothetical protein
MFFKLLGIADLEILRCILTLKSVCAAAEIIFIHSLELFTY